MSRFFRSRRPIAPSRQSLRRRNSAGAVTLRWLYRCPARTEHRAKTWFITGTSKGFGREWAEAALERGDRVAATARETTALAPLVERYGDAVLALRLDVTERAATVAAVQHAASHFGSLDIVINNAGFGHVGMVEELTEAEVRAEST